jgi:hypothetical protein
MARLVSALLGLGLALTATSACFVEDENAVAAPGQVTGEPPALSRDEVAAAEPCSAMLAAMVVASDALDVTRDGPVETGRSCLTCHVTGTLPKLDPVRELPGPLGRRP